ncbi:hypothetical protein [Conexibacter woesei]|uniref:hypothetical protein n=1 Tax=Conexibacter woesei TaxID=191495 RepID=UPI00030B4F4B|nr:hypothetical protein [Conexibacter woesei]
MSEPGAETGAGGSEQGAGRDEPGASGSEPGDVRDREPLRRRVAAALRRADTHPRLVDAARDARGAAAG